MAFHDSAVFPTEISMGSSGGFGHHTVIQVTPPHHKKNRIVRLQEPTGSWRVQWRRSSALSAPIISFVRARRGSAHGFRFFDWNDYSTSTLHGGKDAEINAEDPADRVLIGTGDGVTLRFDMSKVYEDAGTQVVRRITKPMRLAEAQAISNVNFLRTAVAGDVQMVWVDDVLQTEGVEYSIDYSTGEVVFVTAPTAAQTIEWAGYFFVPAIFGAETDELLNINNTQFNQNEFDEITILEDSQDLAVIALERDPGGSRYVVFAASATQHLLSFVDGTNQVMDADACTIGNLPVLLPAGADWMLGGPLFRITCIGAVNSLLVQNSSGAALVTLAPGQTAAFWLSPDGAGTGYQWVWA